MGARSSSDAQRLRQQVQRFVRQFGLLEEEATPCGAPVSPREAHALLLLHEREGGPPLVQADLAPALGIDKSNVTRLVQRLCAAGRVEQVASERDGRARCLRLTARGRRAAEALERSSSQRFQQVLAGIPARERGGVLAALRLLNDAVSACTPAAAPRSSSMTEDAE